MSSSADAVADQLQALRLEIATERAARLAAEALAEDRAKKVFFTQMRSVSSSNAAESASNTDEVRRGPPAPKTVRLEDFLRDVGIDDFVEDAVLESAWTSLGPTPRPAGKLDERRHVHPLVKTVLTAVLPKHLRQWHDETAPDEHRECQIRPDFTITHVRDAMPSTIGGLVLVEVKLPDDMASALQQTRTYLRRRVYQLCRERDAREEACDGVFALGIATDADAVALVCVRSGAPRKGESYGDAEPCPSFQTEVLGLLQPTRQQPRAVPAGFRALMLLFSCKHLGDGAPLSELQGTVPGLDEDEVLVLTQRVGCGGSSDVYAYDDTQAVQAVVKLARFGTEYVNASFGAERDALTALREEATRGFVPTLLGGGHRTGLPQCPYLRLQPRGTPLSEWMAQCVGNAANSEAARVSAATRAVLGVLDALESVHGHGIVHCDVRPSNIVVVGDKPMLVDWGSSCATGAPAGKRGVPAYSDARIWTTCKFVARPSRDVAGALYTWLAAALDGGCVGPWLARNFSCDDDMFQVRAHWVKSSGPKYRGVAALLYEVKGGPQSATLDAARSALLDVQQQQIQTAADAVVCAGAEDGAEGGAGGGAVAATGAVDGASDGGGGGH